MRLVRTYTPDGEPVRPCVATIGFFDGVHRGHRYLIEQVLHAASERGLAAAVVTFPVHPRHVMDAAYNPGMVSTCEEKVQLLAGTGLDYCLMVDFDSHVAQMPARRFMEVMRACWNVRVLVVGYDHRFGHNRSEGFEDYVRYGRELGIDVLPARGYPCQVGGQRICSSYVRRLLHEGQVELAAQCLGRPYLLAGTVVEGHRLGHTIGFPTANLRPGDPDKIVPADGVYAVRAVLDEQEYGGMSCIGHRPTVDNGSERTIETYLFDYRGDAYGRGLALSFVCRTRSEQKFPSVEALSAQLRADERQIRRLLGE